MKFLFHLIIKYYIEVIKLNITQTFKVSSIKEALELLDEYGDKAKIISGGTDLVIELRNHQIDPEVIIDISSIDEMRYIREENGNIHMGAGATFTDIAYCETLDNRLEGLKKSSRLVGSPLIRNRGTVGGNICNGSPAADTVPPLLSLDAVLTIKSINNTRELNIEDIFLDKGQVDLAPEEILTDIIFKKPMENQHLGFSKLGLRNALAISRICMSVYLDLDDKSIIKDIRISSGALGKHGLRERVVEDVIKGLELNQETVNIATKKLVEVVEERLKGRSSLEYKGVAVKSLFVDAINLASKEKFTSI